MSLLERDIDAVLRNKAQALILRDRRFFERFIDPRFRYVTASGFEADKATYIEGVCGADGLRFESQVVSGLHVIEIGHSIIATCALSDVFFSRGVRHAKSFKAMLVLAKRDGVWRWIAGQTMEPKGL